MSRQRDHRAEYRRRIERGVARGLSRAQARGHPAASQDHASTKVALAADPKLEAALKRFRQAPTSLRDTAKLARVSPERLSRYIKTVAGAERAGGIWTFNDQRVRNFAIVEVGAGRPQKIRVRGFEAAHLAGLHFHEAGHALRDQRLASSFVRRWEGQRIKDVEGRWHTLSTDLNQLYEAVNSHDYSFERFYKIES